MDGCDAGDWARLAVGVAGLQVSVSEGEEPPDHSEEHPGAEEGRGEDEEGVLPLQVHHGGENVLQEATLNHTTKPPVSKPSSLFPRSTPGPFLPIARNNIELILDSGLSK